MLESLRRLETFERTLDKWLPSEPGPAQRSTEARAYPDPVDFARYTLGIEPWKRAQDILHAVRDHDRVTVRSGHKVAKTNSAGILAWWWTSDPVARPGARAILTSSSFPQLKNVLWKEIRDLHRRAKQPLGATPPLDPATAIRWPDGREIIGFTTKDKEKAAGFSGANLLFVLDEASGIPEEIFEALEGNRAGGAKIVLFSNPTQTSGTFFESHHEKRSFWFPLHISSEESPNVTGEGAPVPGLATKAYVEEKRQEWGEDSPLYEVRVRGNFPPEGSDTIIGLAAVTAAVQRWEDDPTEPDDRLHLGVDVARTGDDEVICYPRRGLRALPPRVIPNGDGPHVAGHVVLIARELRRSPHEIPLVKIDSNGVGASPYDVLVQSDEIETVGVNTAEVSDSPEEFYNLRSQLHFGLKEWLKAGGAIPDDGKTLAELVAAKFGFDPRNRLKVERKDEIKKRIKRSPDRADALQLAVYEPVPAPRFERPRIVGRKPDPIFG